MSVDSGEHGRDGGAMLRRMMKRSRVLFIDAQVMPGSRRQRDVLKSRFLSSAKVNVIEASLFCSLVVLIIVVRPRSVLCSSSLYRK